MKRKILLYLFGALSSITAFTQTIDHNQALADLISTKKWFEIENYYQQHKDSIDNEFVTRWYFATAGSVFNRHEEAINEYEQLIDNSQAMGMMALMYLFGQPALQLCVDVQEYEKGEELCKKLITIVQEDTIAESDIRLSYIQILTQSIENLKLYQKIFAKPIIYKIVNKTEDIKLIPNKEDNGIYINPKWNGFNLKTLFDTGASGGGYIRNKAIAEKIGVKLNTSDTIMVNNGKMRAIPGVIDSLELGEFIIKNIPVFVNVETIDSTDPSQVLCDSVYNTKFDIVLGTQIIRQLGLIEFDFVNNTMSFPQKTRTFKKRNLYFENSGLFMNIEICSENFLCFFDTGGDQGLTINTDFYERYKQHISVDAQAKQVRSAIGNCNEESIQYRFEYNCPSIDIIINDVKITLINDCSVAKDKENDNELAPVEGGFLGNAIFKYCNKATFDFDNMIFDMQK